MAQITFILGGLIILASCGEISSQVQQPQADTNVPPEVTWVAVDSAYQSPELKTVYFDPETIRRNGDLVTLWELTDYEWMQGNAEFGQFMLGPNRFLSTKAHKQFDCANKRVSLLASLEFSYHMGTGIPNEVQIDPDHWLPVIPKTINYALWEIACDTL